MPGQGAAEARAAAPYGIRAGRQAAVQPVVRGAGAEWSGAEVAAIVGDYLEMLAAEARGLPYSKASHRRALQPRLSSARTAQAIEYKHANISAAMLDLGLPCIRGYKPRGNYQAALTEEIRRRIEGQQALAALRPAQPPSMPAGQLQPQAPPPPPQARKRAGRHIDYGLLHEENRRLGALGEQLVAEYEATQLRSNGRADLAERVRWAARDDGDGLGYDVLSFDAAGNERQIEVKTTALDALTPFYLSSAELDFARSHQSSYAMYRVYHATTKNPRFYALDGDILGSVDLTPVSYRAQLKSQRPADQ